MQPQQEVGWRRMRGAVAYPDDGAKCRQWRIRMAGAHCALGLLVLFGLRHRPLGASHSEEKDSAKKIVTIRAGGGAAAPPARGHEKPNNESQNK